jgi:serine/threonine protein kinase
MTAIVVMAALRKRRLMQMQKSRKKEESLEEDDVVYRANILEALRQSVPEHPVVAGSGHLQVHAYVIAHESDHAIPADDADEFNQVEFIPPPYSFDEVQEEMFSGQLGITELLRESIHLGDPKLQAYTGSMLQLAGIPLNSGMCRASYKGLDYDLKALSVEASEEERCAFLQEAFIQAQFSHPNVVQLIGVVTVDDPLLIVMEYMANNTLSLYLQEQGSRLPSRLHPAFPPGTSSLFAMAHDIASAMTYLESKKFVHGTLTSCSTFVMYNGVCKVSNFGASLKHYTRDNNDPPLKLIDLPVRWSAPEVLEHSDFTTASDVWSYGIILYELWTSGAKPYEYWSNIKVSDQVRNGHRLPCPSSCPAPVYNMMLNCWNMDPCNRPPFYTLLSCLPSVAMGCTEPVTHR